MPLDVFGELRSLFGKLLCTILAKESLTSFVSFTDGLYGVKLGDCHQLHLRWYLTPYLC